MKLGLSQERSGLEQLSVRVGVWWCSFVICSLPGPGKPVWT